MSMIDIYWYDDNGMLAASYAAHPLWGWRTFAKAGLEE